MRTRIVLTTLPGKHFVSYASGASSYAIPLRPSGFEGHEASEDRHVNEGLPAIALAQAGSRKHRFFPRRSVKPLQVLKSWPALLMRGLVKCYQWGISPFLPSVCRFHPSCSTYMSDAIARHGAFKGMWLGAKRLLRCGPWGPYGFDPVPENTALLKPHLEVCHPPQSCPVSTHE